MLNFGNEVLFAGYLYNRKNKPSYFGAVYEYPEDGRHDSESTIGLCTASEVEFKDDGHAIAWAMNQTKQQTEHTRNGTARLCLSYLYIEDHPYFAYSRQ
ncbi:hypothetical protein [Bifidobacterium thermacidophilum]|uniref:Nmad4 family putative nucleotide modification protein n=1 Tax=Bifidobacterium thermacidophilum TaxID=246618 RepID=UPI003F0DD280